MAGPVNVVVSRTGKATVAWAGQPIAPRFLEKRIVRVADDPPALGDPQEPPPPQDPQGPHDAQVDALLSSGSESPGGSLGIDGADVRTVLWNQDLLTPSGEFTEFYDVVISDRASRGGWSTSPVVVTGYLWTAGLAVNASGAAVVAWQEAYDPRRDHVYASYRQTARAGWASPERVAHAASVDQVGIDDAGRVLLLYRSKNRSLQAIRRSPEGVWGEPQRIGGPDTAAPSGMALGAGGAAVVTHNRWTDDGGHGRQFTSRMSPNGAWGTPVLQPHGFDEGPRAVDMDAKGRAMLAWWRGTDLMARWSRPDGRWRKPCVLAGDVSHPRRREGETQLVTNRRGDAVVVWRTKDREAQLWARYKTAGHDWMEPVNVTPTHSSPGWNFGVGLGDAGHAAIAWTTRHDQQIQVRRLTPTP